MSATRLILLLLFPLSASAATPVTTSLLGELLIPVEHSAPATLLAQNSPDLAAEVSARVDAIEVRVGDIVAADQPLVRLDCRLLDAALDANRALLRQLDSQQRFARSQLTRANDLKRRNSISDEELERRQSELDSLQAQLAAQRARLAQSEIQVGHCLVRAPFRAVISARLASVGDLATPGTPLLRLVQLDDLELSAQLRDQEAAGLAAGTRYWFEYQDRRVPARLRRLLPVVDSITRSREARLSIDADGLPAGAAGRLVWQAPQPAVPAEYLVRRQGRLGLFLLQDGKAHFHVLPDALEGQPAGVSLPATRLVIVQGRHGLEDGDPVTPADANQGPTR
jgi:RND family efflux transporter MFP subunit